jgi:DNA-binding MarR family transcriptional regulator
MKRFIPKSNPEAAFSLSEQEIEAARRLLTLLSGAAEGPGAAGQDNAGIDRGHAIERAVGVMRLRRRRTEVVGETFVVEAAFHILLALYVNEVARPEVSLTELSELAGVAFATTARWVDILLPEGWIERAESKNTQRLKLRLSGGARERLDRLFSEED